LAAKVEAGEDRLLIDGRPIRVFSERDPGAIPWKSVGVDIVIEATGFFTDRAKAEMHIVKGGAKRVIISAPGKSFEGLTNIVDVYVRQLRMKIDEGHELKLLRTVRGVGYSISEEGA
jgi:glyceraldehyde-3-phosphate dehydrogenase/erythrose-4-phosphate dehydrogenase